MNNTLDYIRSIEEVRGNIKEWEAIKGLYS